MYKILSFLFCFVPTMVFAQSKQQAINECKIELASFIKNKVKTEDICKCLLSNKQKAANSNLSYQCIKEYLNEMTTNNALNLSKKKIISRLKEQMDDDAIKEAIDTDKYCTCYYNKIVKKFSAEKLIAHFFSPDSKISIKEQKCILKSKRN